MKARVTVALATFALTVLQPSAWAHAGPANSETLGWVWPASIVAPLALSAVLYAVGTLKMWRRGGARSILAPAFYFAVGWLSLLIALDSPIHELSEHLFWVHMTQHEILMLVSAPLLVLGRPLVPFLWALPARWREIPASWSRNKPFRAVWAAISAPAAAWSVHALALWIWHAPRLFDATLDSEFIHSAQHVSFLATALLFWWALVHGHDSRLGYGAAALYVFTTAVHTSLLGALLTFAPTAWYAPYASTAPAWGLSGLEDQQLGGLIMWIPAGTVLLVITLIFIRKWIGDSERRWQYTRTAALLRASSGAPDEN